MAHDVVRIGRLFAAVTATAGQVLLILPGSQNTRGVLVTSLTISSATGATGYFYADTQAPSSPGDTTKKLVWTWGDPPSNGQTATFPYPFAIDPGLSVWFAAGTANSSVVMTYDLLNGDA